MSRHRNPGQIYYIYRFQCFNIGIKSQHLRQFNADIVVFIGGAVAAGQKIDRIPPVDYRFYFSNASRIKHPLFSHFPASDFRLFQLFCHSSINNRLVRMSDIPIKPASPPWRRKPPMEAFTFTVNLKPQQARKRYCHKPKFTILINWSRINSERVHYQNQKN